LIIRQDKEAREEKPPKIDNTQQQYKGEKAAEVTAEEIKASSAAPHPNKETRKRQVIKSTTTDKAAPRHTAKECSKIKAKKARPAKNTSARRKEASSKKASDKDGTAPASAGEKVSEQSPVERGEKDMEAADRTLKKEQYKVEEGAEAKEVKQSGEQKAAGQDKEALMRRRGGGHMDGYSMATDEGTAAQNKTGREKRHETEASAEKAARESKAAGRKNKDALMRRNGGEDKDGEVATSVAGGKEESLSGRATTHYQEKAAAGDAIGLSDPDQHKDDDRPKRTRRQPVRLQMPSLANNPKSRKLEASFFNLMFCVIGPRALRPRPDLPTTSQDQQPSITPWKRGSST